MDGYAPCCCVVEVGCLQHNTAECAQISSCWPIRCCPPWVCAGDVSIDAANVELSGCQDQSASLQHTPPQSNLLRPRSRRARTRLMHRQKTSRKLSSEGWGHVVQSLRKSLIYTLCMETLLVTNYDSPHDSGETSCRLSSSSNSG